MSLFDKLFGPKQVKPAEQVSGYFKTLTGYQPVFRSLQGSLYEAELTRAVIDAGARHASKLKPETLGAASKTLKANLKIRINPWQTTSQFLYRLWTIWKHETTAFIIPVMDATGTVVEGLFPVLPSSVEIVEVAGEPWVRFSFPGGERAAVEFARVGILTKFQFRDDFFGAGNAALDPTLELLDIQRQGQTEAVKSSATLRFMARLAQVFTPETMKKERKRFAEDNLSSENDTGILMFDGKYADIKQIDSKPWLVDAEQMKLIKDNIFGYLGMNESILQNKYTEAEFDAFYEGELEPFALQLGQVLTCMLFTDREIAAGNEIMFSSSRLQYASNRTKLQVATQLEDRGVLSNWTAAEIFNLPRPPGPERWYRRGEYKDINEHNDNPDPEPDPDAAGVAPEGGTDAS